MCVRVCAESDSEAEAWRQDGHPSGCTELITGQLTSTLLLL